MVEATADERRWPVQIPKSALSDLLRKAATCLAPLSIRIRVTEAVLDHASGTGGGIVAVYHRQDIADEKRHAPETWGSS